MKVIAFFNVRLKVARVEKILVSEPPALSVSLGNKIISIILNFFGVVEEKSNNNLQ